MGAHVDHTDGSNGGHIDWMCVVRYVLYGALLGGFFADQLFSPGAVSVYAGATIGGLLLGGLKLAYLLQYK